MYECTMQLPAIPMHFQAIAMQSPVNQPDDPCFVKTRAQNGAKSAKTCRNLQNPLGIFKHVHKKACSRVCTGKIRLDTGGV